MLHRWKRGQHFFLIRIIILERFIFIFKMFYFYSVYLRYYKHL